MNPPMTTSMGAYRKEVKYMNIMHKIGSSVASISMIAAVSVPVAFAAGDTEILLHGNGADSSSSVEVVNKDKTTVEQQSSTIVVNEISNSSSTGGNKISGTTGTGDQSIVSGDAKSVVNVGVTGGSNAAEVNTCGCEGTTTVEVSDNGVDSTQSVVLKLKNKLKVLQGSITQSITGISNKSKTGKNKIKNSTGTESNTIESGSATSKTTVEVEGGSNVYTPTVL